MADFSHLAAQAQVRKDVVRFVFAGLMLDGADGPPWMDVTLCDVSNRPYFNAFIATRRAGMPVAQTDEELFRQRRIDARLYANYGVKNMGNIVDVAGKPVPFNPKNALDFLRQVIKIAYWEFDTFRGFIQTPQNFHSRPDDGGDEDDEDDVGTGAPAGDPDGQGVKGN